ncbi:MAG: CaiB/BaiF CoA-transferase family protein [Alphaproteobacteria bacterium]|nr:CaiB/BaiF CoA-transferase family protein [Alphaproteobacteria bacterium]
MLASSRIARPSHVGDARMINPLEGMLVVSLEQAVAAPFLSSRLGEAGARVIKIERPEGDFARGYDKAVKGQSSYFVWLNRGKESIILDIKRTDDADLLRRMIAKADIFIQNLAPGAAARAGFGAEELRRAHPRLITCDISGYGEEGPYAEMKAYDLLVQAESGLASITGTADGPGRVGVSLVDIAAGMYALAGVYRALIARGRTGEGASLKISLFDAIADWMTVPLLHHDYGGKAPKRVGLNHPSLAPYGLYETADGPVVFGIQNEREWATFCTSVLEQPALAEDATFKGNNARVQNRPALDKTIGAVFAKLTRAEVVARLRKAKIAYGVLNSVADFSKHPQLRRQSGKTPGGPVDFVAPPVHVMGEGTEYGRVPALGEHTDAIRREFAV